MRTVRRTGTDSMTDAAQRASWVPLVAVAAFGAACTAAASAIPASGGGARRMGDPSISLMAFDAVWTCLLARPGRRDAAETLTLVALGLPFHAAFAGASGAAGAHFAAFAAVAASWSLAALSCSASAAGAPDRGSVAGLAVAAFGLPLAGYAAAEFLDVPGAVLVRASPVTGPILLGRSPGTAALADAVPAVAAAAAVAALAGLRRARRSPGP